MPVVGKDYQPTTSQSPQPRQPAPQLDLRVQHLTPMLEEILEVKETRDEWISDWPGVSLTNAKCAEVDNVSVHVIEISCEGKLKWVGRGMEAGKVRILL